MKKTLLKALRVSNSIILADRLRFFYHYFKSSKRRAQFKKRNPSVTLPPAYHIYETFGLGDYNSYYFGSIETSQNVLKHFKKHISTDNIKLLDWGCGTGRVIRHFPTLLEPASSCFGTDYNSTYINWFKANIPNFNFSENKLKLPTVYSDNYFDAIYGISIFTHLSEEMHYKWFEELMRILKPNGVLKITLSGNAFINKLSKKEKEQFLKGELVEHKSYRDGHRSYASHQPKTFVIKKVGKHQVLEHIPRKIKNGTASQDIWLIRKV